jgi:hypothetical protein
MRRTPINSSQLVIVLAIASAAVCAAAILAIAARGRDRTIVRSVENGGDWYARSPAWYATRGLYPTEHAPDGSAYAWAGGRVRIQIPRLDRRMSHTFGVRARSGRAPNEPPSFLRIAVDGVEGEPRTLGGEWQDIDIDLPIAPRQGATILVEADRTFTPGPNDPRALAFMIDRVALTSEGAIGPSRGVLIDVALFAGAVALAAAVCLLPPALVFAAGLAAGGAASWLVLVDAAFLGPYSGTFASLAIAVAISAGIASALARVGGADVRRFWRMAACLAIVVTSLKLAVFLHPNAPVSDGMFHVHRAQAVRAGDYIFTSITPQPFYEFPYPIGLYVVAQPLWDRATDRVALLRGITIVADGLVALALYAVVSRRWGQETGLLASAIALAVPVVTQSVATANLTNVFAQSCFSLGVLWIAWHLPSTRIAVATAGAVLLLCAAYLSHFSTAVIGMPAAIVIAAAVPLARDDRERAAWRWIAASVLLALAISYVVYYSHFHDVYARTLSRVGAEGADTSLVATLGEHSERKPVTLLRFLLSNYGWAALALSAVGFVAAVRRGWRDAWTLVLLALSATVAGFLVLGAFTPIEMRANLAAQPVVAALAALGCRWLWRRGHIAIRVVTAALFIAIIWLGMSSARIVLG